MEDIERRMADRLENPPAAGNPQFPEKRLSAAVPRMLDDAVYLPESSRIDPAGPEFEQLLRQNLPAEAAPDVIAQWKGLSRRPTRLQWVAAVIFLLAAGFLLWYFFPPLVYPVPVRLGGMEIADKFPNLRSSSPYRRDFDRAWTAFRNGNYCETAEILKPCAAEIIRSRSPHTDGKLLYLYFQSIRERKAGGGKMEAVGELRILRDK